ncbi:MAG: hypothetical protein IPL23_15550 [Saprospiraceae bacterium]|nr:hypothetical protein [Saprospiraceae bacterium]
MKIRSVLKYALNSQTYVRYLLVIAIIIFLYYVIRLFFSFASEDFIFPFLDPIFGLITGMLALALWYNDLQERWEESLPKTLTVHFSYKNEYVLTCYEAYLSHQADIRNFGQQIGNQMNGSKNLNFYPFMHQLPRLLRTNKKGEKYWNYEIYFFLRDDIDNDQKQIIWFENNLDDLGESKVRELVPRETVDMESNYVLQT